MSALNKPRQHIGYAKEVCSSFSVVPRVGGMLKWCSAREATAGKARKERLPEQSNRNTACVICIPMSEASEMYWKALDHRLIMPGDKEALALLQGAANRWRETNHYCNA